MARWLRRRRLGMRGTKRVVGGGVYQPSVLDTHIYADIHAVRFIFSRCSSSRVPYVYMSLWLYVCVVPLSTSCSSAHVQAWPYNSNVETPLTGTRIPDITFTHVIPHQFLETKAVNIWWREWARCGLVDEVRASISPGPASNFLLLPFVPFPPFLLISRLASSSGLSIVNKVKCDESLSGLSNLSSALHAVSIFRLCYLHSSYFTLFYYSAFSIANFYLYVIKLCIILQLITYD